MTPTLCAHFPELRDLPYISFGQLPTPIDSLDKTSRALGIHKLFIKRDDLSGALYGGNKPRKLEFILADAKRKGAQDVLTIGAIGSHHVLATSIYARDQGLQPAAQHWPQPITPHVLDNLRALSTTTPELRLLGHPAAIPFHLFKRKLHDWLEQRPQTYFVSGGGSSTLGVLGYVNAALELRDQIDAGLTPEPDIIFVAAGTNGTLAGLILGAKLAGLRTKIIGVRVVEKVVTNTANVLRLTHAATSLLRKHGLKTIPEVGCADVTLLNTYFGSGYGVSTPEAEEAISLLKRTEHIHLEPTYTGKTFAALMGERDRLELSHKTVLYWNTLSSADLSDRIARADVERDLPRAYIDFFKDAPQSVST